MAQPPEQTEKPASQAQATPRLSQRPIGIGPPPVLPDYVTPEADAYWTTKYREAQVSLNTGEYDTTIELIRGHLADPEFLDHMRIPFLMILAACYWFSAEYDESLGWVGKAESRWQELRRSYPEGEDEEVDDFISAMRENIDNISATLVQSFTHADRRNDLGVGLEALENVLKNSGDTDEGVDESDNDITEAVEILMAESIKESSLSMMETIKTLLLDHQRRTPAAMRSPEDFECAGRTFAGAMRKSLDRRMRSLLGEAGPEEMQAIKQELDAAMRKIKVLERENKFLKTENHDLSAWVTHVQGVVASGPVHAREASAGAETESSAGETQEAKEEPSRVPSSDSSHADKTPSNEP